MTLLRRLFHAPDHEQARADDAHAREFVSLLKAKGIEVKIAEAVIRRIRQGCADKAHTVRLADDLYRVYGIVDDDLDDLVVSLCKETLGASPAKADVFGVAPVHTVEDLAALIQHVKNLRGL